MPVALLRTAEARVGSFNRIFADKETGVQPDHCVHTDM